MFGMSQSTKKQQQNENKLGQKQSVNAVIHSCTLWRECTHLALPTLLFDIRPDWGPQVCFMLGVVVVVWSDELLQVLTFT